MNTLSDKELKALFDGAEPLPRDERFTRRVMSSLPKKERKGSSLWVWVFGLVGLGVSIATGALFGFLNYFLKFGIELTKAQMPDYSSITVYLLVLGLVVASSFNVMRRHITLSF